MFNSFQINFLINFNRHSALIMSAYNTNLSVQTTPAAELKKSPAPHVKSFTDMIRNAVTLLSDSQTFTIIVQEGLGGDKLGKFTTSNLVRVQCKRFICKHTASAIKLGRVQLFGSHLKCLFESTIHPILTARVQGLIVLQYGERTIRENKFVRRSLANDAKPNQCKLSPFFIFLS